MAGISIHVEDVENERIVLTRLLPEAPEMEEMDYASALNEVAGHGWSSDGDLTAINIWDTVTIRVRVDSDGARCRFSEVVTHLAGTVNRAVERIESGEGHIVDALFDGGYPNHRRVTQASQPTLVVAGVVVEVNGTWMVGL